MPGTSPASAVESELAPPAASERPRAPKTRPPAYPGLTAALARHAADATRRRARETLFASAPYRLSLRGALPDRPVVLPDALMPATLEAAQEILRGRIALPSGTIEARGISPFDVKAEAILRAELHRFEWLAHLDKAGGKTAFFVAKALLEDWLDRFSRFEAFAWRGDILGARLASWAAHLPFLLVDNDLIFRSRLLKAMAEQARHLPRALKLTEPGLKQLEAAAALVTIGPVLALDGTQAARASDALRVAIAEAVLPDGGIATRNPRDQILALAALTRAARTLSDARRPLPAFLEPVLGTMRACLALLRHGDGRLGCFNGGAEEGDAPLDELLDGAPLDGGSAIAPDWRYARLAAGRSVVLLDGGGPPPGALATGAHAAPLALEFSHGDQRLVVNGGVARRRGAEWIDIARRTSAHASVEIGGCDAGAILEGRAARALGPRLYGGTAQTTLEAGAGGLWADGSHDLYAARCAATHRRRLYLDPSGEDLRGEDKVIRALGRARGRLAIAIRFPLHPDIRATLQQGGDGVLLAPPGGAAWRFRAGPLGAETTLGLEEAVYMGGDSVRRTQAIVLRANPAGESWTMRWAFKLDGSEPRPRRRVV